MTYKNKYYNTNTQVYYGLSVLEYGWQQSGPKHRYGPLIRQHFVLHFIKNGSGFYTADGRRFALKKNDVFIIFPGADTWYEASIKEPWEYWWIGFTGLDAPQLIAQTGAVKEHPFFSISDGANLLTLFEGLKLPSDSAYNMSATLLKIFDELAIQIKQQKSCRNLNYLVTQSFAIIADKKGLITVAELSGMIGISRSHLFRIFQNELDMSPQRYMIMYRLRTAMTLLQNSTLQISQIAEDTGFCDSSHFSREMKKYFNITPMECREAAKKVVSRTESPILKLL